jgi:hypothetical protein
MSLAVLVPSRGRPGNARRLVDAFADTIELSDTVLILGLDEDDPELDNYRDALAGTGVAAMIGPRLRLGGTLNRMAADNCDGFDVLGFMGDDHVPRTPGWDVLVQAALMERPGYCYGDDLLQGENLPTAVFVTAAVVRELGFFQPPGLVHLYFDNFWLDMGRAVGITYLPDVVIEHMHFLNGKAPVDARYTEVNAASMYEHDGRVYARYRSEDFDGDAARVRAVLDV